MKANGDVKHNFVPKISVGTMTESDFDFDTPLTIPEATLSDLQSSSSDYTSTSVAKRIVTVLPGSSSILSKLSPYLIALRPWSFTASLGPVALGSSLAFKSLSVFNLWIYFVTNICALSAHAAGNLVNTYVDFTRGVDSKKSDDRTLVDRLLSPADVVTMGAVSYCVGCVGLLLLAAFSPAPLERLALVYFGGLSASFLYTGGLGLKYIALGDVAILLTFGPVTVLFAYISQGGELSWAPLIYAVPLALNTEAILHSNNTRDLEMDREAGIVTLAILAGRTGSYMIFALLLFTPYIVFALLTANASRWFVLPLLTVLFAFNTERQFRRGDLSRMPQTVASLNFKLAVAYVAACTFAERSTLPGLT